MTPPRQAAAVVAPFAPTVGEVLVDHPEVDDEVAGKLGLQRPVFAITTDGSVGAPPALLAGS